MVVLCAILVAADLNMAIVQSGLGVVVVVEWMGRAVLAITSAHSRVFCCGTKRTGPPRESNSHPKVYKPVTLSN